MDLCSLPGHALSCIIAKLPWADCRRLAATCRCMKQLARDSVSAVLLSQQDLEDWADEREAFSFPCTQQLHLQEISLDAECVLELTATAPQLLHGLKTLQITNPAWLDAEALLQLVSSCPGLSQLCVRGSWQCGSSSTLQSSQHVKPQQLQTLMLQRNSNVSQEQLLALLLSPSAAVHDSNDSSPGLKQPGCTCEAPCSCSSSYRRPHQLPNWCRALAATTSSSELCEGVTGTPNSLPCPTWPQLTALDLTACPKLGASLAFLAWCPSLLSLCMHSCFKVADTVLQDFATALHADGNTDNNWHDDGHTLSPARSGDSQAQRNSTTAAAVAGVHAEAGEQEADSSSTVPLLQRLDLSYTRVRDGGVPHLVAALPRLSWLGLKGCNVGDDGLQHLLRLPHLTALHIKHCHRVTDEGIQGLSVLSQLRSLSYGYTSMPEADDVAACIARHFPHLTALDLLASELTDTGIAAFGKLPHLHELKLYQAGVTAEGLSMLAGQPAGSGLHSLVLYGTGGLRELACLGHFPVLQQLQLGRLCDLALPMATALRDLTQIQTLTGLTLERMDDINTDVLQHILKGCKELQQLRARGCDGVCQEDMEELAQDAAGGCHSSASVWWAAAPSCDTDDEEDGWQLLQP